MPNSKAVDFATFKKNFKYIKDKTDKYNTMSKSSYADSYYFPQIKIENFNANLRIFTAEELYEYLLLKRINIYFCELAEKVAMFDKSKNVNINKLIKI